MRISGIQRVNEIYKAQTTKVEPNKTAQQDAIMLSNKAKDYQYAFKLAKDAPDVRTDEINKIKERIQTGTYTIDAKEVSEKMMNQFDMKG